MLFAFTACQPKIVPEEPGETQPEIKVPEPDDGEIPETADEIIKNIINAIDKAENKTSLGEEFVFIDSTTREILMKGDVDSQFEVYKEFTVGDIEFKLGIIEKREDGFYQGENLLFKTLPGELFLNGNVSVASLEKTRYENVSIGEDEIPVIIQSKQSELGGGKLPLITIYEFPTPYKDIERIENYDDVVCKIIGGEYEGEYSFPEIYNKA